MGRGSEDRPANYSGVVALDTSGAIQAAGWTVGLDETQAWVERHATKDTLLVVDAPLVIANLTRQRLADKQVGQRYGRWWVSANSVNLSSPRQAGVHLRERLEQDGWSYSDGLEGPPRSGRALSECYPYTTIVGPRSWATTTNVLLISANRRGCAPSISFRCGTPHVTS